ncbi:hypothetical protein Gogos_020982 [Gossypium gossypioides]|uniref:Uncharacterized protein n=1 Tax=Gossypium gossypioides TaxID=34282 RepID=A0A7J9D291_GOSGO|nr:hypothetical protein [Gossypium gossypioides]
MCIWSQINEPFFRNMWMS